MEQIYVNSQKEEEDSKEYIVTDDEISNANKCINKSELKINCELMKMLKNTNLFLINKNIFIQIDYLINNANSLKSKIKYDKQNIENIIFTSALILFQRFINDKMQFQFFNKIFAFVLSLFHLKVVSLFPLIKRNLQNLPFSLTDFQKRSIFVASHNLWFLFFLEDGIAYLLHDLSFQPTQGNCHLLFLILVQEKKNKVLFIF